MADTSLQRSVYISGGARGPRAKIRGFRVELTVPEPWAEQAELTKPGGKGMGANSREFMHQISDLVHDYLDKLGIGERGGET